MVLRQAELIKNIHVVVHDQQRCPIEHSAHHIQFAVHTSPLASDNDQIKELVASRLRARVMKPTKGPLLDVRRIEANVTAKQYKRLLLLQHAMRTSDWMRCCTFLPPGDPAR